MLKGKSFKKLLSILIAMIMVMGSFSSLVYADGNGFKLAKEELQKEAASKFMPEVKEDMEKEDILEVLVYLKDQVDTKNVAEATRKAVSMEMTPYNTRLQVRRAVVEALVDKAEMTQYNLLKYLEQEKAKGNVIEYDSHYIVNMVYVKATKEVIENISYRPEVGKIYKNKTHYLERPAVNETEGAEIIPQATDGVEWNIERVKADMAWDLGVDGTGAVVGSLDSGVDWTHPALKNKWRGYDPVNDQVVDVEKNWFDPVYGASLPADSDSHGTHVMGTMVGQEPDGSNKVGVAPGAKWITARVFNTAGSTTDQILLDAADWMARPGEDPDAAPDVVNNSWGGLDGIDDWYRDAVNNYINAEIFVVFSAGNQRQGEPLPWPGSIACPANYPESFAVAATDRNDLRASFSKLGPSPYDETLIKPEISAPGVGIRSSIPGGQYTGAYSGTSMSAPHVSGTVALLRSIDQSLTVEEIRDILTRTASPLTDETYPESPNFGYGYGLLDAFAAVSEIVSGIGRVEGKVLVEGEDTDDAVIIHEQEVTQAFVGSDIEIEARVMDDVAVTEVELLVQPEGKSYWYLVPMARVSGDHRDGVYKGTITYDMLIADSLKYRIRARDYAGEAVITEDYVIEVSFGIVPDEYTQGFEGQAIGWIFDGCWEYGEAVEGVDPVPYEGEGLAGTVIGGLYPNYADDWLVTPPIDLRDATLPAASLRFNHWYNIETNYDNGYIYVTNDFGETWNLVGGPYTGASGNWQEVVVNLNDYIGSPNPVFVGFHFTSDLSVNKEGWYIDNVRLMGPDRIPPQVPTNVMVETGVTGIKLSWTPSPDGDVSHYNIYRSEASGGEYVKIGETSSNVYVDSDIVGGTTYYYVINAEDTSGNVSEFTNEVSAVAPEIEIIFREDFEEDDGGFVSGIESGTANDWEWGIPTSGPNGAASGEKVWATNLDGTYSSSQRSYIESPEIPIPEDEDKEAFLVFNHWYNMENSFDYGYVQISNDNGQTWTNLTGKITNVSNGWVNTQLSLLDYRGDNIKIRFYFYSDGSFVRDGWYIDDVTVAVTDYVIPPVIAYDDGTAENALVLNAAGNGLAVRFTPPLEGRLLGTYIYLWSNDWPSPGGNRLGFAVFQEDEDGTLNQIGETIFVDNLTRGGWNYIDFTGYNFTTDEDFYISTVQDDIGNNVPGTGIDNDSPYSDRSYLYVDGEMVPMSTEVEGALMIRAYMEYTGTEPAAFAMTKAEPVKGIVAKAGKAATALNSKEMVKEKEPDFVINRNTVSLDRYGIVSDEEVRNTPMSRGWGIPAQDATVTILETGRTVKVDPVTGKYSMQLPVGTYTLRAEAYGYYPQDEVVTVTEEEVAKQSFLLQEKPRGTITGRVIDRYWGDPASFAEIRIVEDKKVAPVTADENGYFTIPNVLVGTYTLSVTADGFNPGEFTVTVNANEVTEVELGLKRFVGYQHEIAYDDGTAENALVLNAAGNGLAVRFTPESQGLVKGLNIYFWGNDWPSPGGNRMGFVIYDIVDGKPVQVGEPIYVDNLIRGGWNYIDLSGYGFVADGDFFISTMQDDVGSNHPGTGIDDSSPYGDRSYLNVGGEFIPMSDEGVEGALMMRAIVLSEVDTPVITNLGEINYTNQDSITVEGTVTFDATVNVYVNDELAASVETEDLRFAAEVELPLDENIIMVTAELDGKETEPSPEVIVVKDKVLPTLTVTEPEDNARINVEVVHVVGNVTDDIGMRELLVNDEPVEIDEEGNFHKRILVNEGENVITVRAIDLAGNETVITRTVYVGLEAPEITNIEPSTDVTLRAGEVLNVSFNAPSGGQGYFRLLLPFNNGPQNLGIPMTETEEGLYEGTWTVPEGVAATGLQVQVIFIDQYGHEITAIAEGRVTIIGNMEYLAANTVIIGDEAFDIEYLNNNATAQIKLIEWFNSGREVYIKLNENTIVNQAGELVDMDVLPEAVTYYDVAGNVLFYEK